MEQAHWFAFVGVVLAFIGFRVYNSKDNKINTATWFLWVVGDALEAGSFFVMTGEDFLKNAVPLAFAFGSLVTFIIAIERRRFGLPDAGDRKVIFVDLLISAGWWKNIWDAGTANIMFVLTEVISFVPLYRGVLTGKEREYILPWILWAAADVLFFATVRSVSHTTEELIYPVAQAAAHVVVVLCIGIRAVVVRASR